MAEPVSVSRRIEAPAAAIFAVLADPARHPEIDGSGTVRASAGPAPLEKVGDTFAMRMSNNLAGDYTVTNRVVEFERDRLIAWTPQVTSVSNPKFQDTVGREGAVRWSYALAPDGENATIVTETHDYSRLPEQVRERILRTSEFWHDGMKRSLENLDRLATRDQANR